MSQQIEPKIPVFVHILCGIPLILIVISIATGGPGGFITGAIRGAISGGLGGLAYGINIAIYKKGIQLPVVALISIATTGLAFGIWWVIVSVF